MAARQGQILKSREWTRMDTNFYLSNRRWTQMNAENQELVAHAVFAPLNPF
jgi:hypothetical protein